MSRNVHELKKNLQELVTEREHWCTALTNNTAPFALKNVAGAHIRELDRRIQNLHWLLSIEEDK